MNNSFRGFSMLLYLADRLATRAKDSGYSFLKTNEEQFHPWASSYIKYQAVEVIRGTIEERILSCGFFTLKYLSTPCLRIDFRNNSKKISR